MARKMKAQEIPEKEAGDIIREALKERYMLQVDLADKMGIRQASLSGNINRKRISLDVFWTVMNAMEYDVAVIDRTTGEVMWKVTTK